MDLRHDAACMTQSLGKLASFDKSSIPHPFEMIINGKTITDIKLAGKMLQKEAAISSFGHPIATYAGYPIIANTGQTMTGKPYAELTWVGVAKKATKLIKTPDLLIKNLLKEIEGLLDYKEYLQKQVQKLTQEADRLEQRLGDNPFPDEELLQELQEKQREMEAEIAKYCTEDVKIDPDEKHPFELLLEELQLKREMLSDDDLDEINAEIAAAELKTGTTNCVIH